MTDPLEMECAVDALPLDTVASRWIVVIDPDTAINAIRPYLEMGFTHLVFHSPAQDRRRFLVLFERDLAPRLRDLVTG